jgi:hypothetical protein
VSEFEIVHVIALVGWLILVAGSFASYRLNWGAALRMGLVWVAIFVGLVLLFDIVRGG